ncbi:MAG: bifunctional 3-demethylubiquinol 3-O-methyltransferase/2-polyprenyl-6-hydroxyphenol methylase [Rickettsiales bacterium]|nr:MAG: bifunctional 3-demethylubiquinol 3-O-methyltransferase/2-polyprenyl-6-hydroxyphenol methylase [Rickettsiales bacterium]
MSEKSSINQHELNKFNKTEQEWWDLAGEFKLLHKINPVRIEYISSVIGKQFPLAEANSPFSDLKILDVGSGGGLICAPLCKLGAKVTGLDANAHNTKASSEHAKRNNLDIEYIHKTAEEHVKSSPKYDVVLCLEVVEHVANPKEFVLNLSKMVADGGVLILSTINRTVKSYANAIIMAEYVLGWVPKQTHDHSKFVKPSEFASMLEGSCLRLSELKGLSLSMLSQEWHLSDDIDVNYFASFVDDKKL